MIKQLLLYAHNFFDVLSEYVRVTENLSIFPHNIQCIGKDSSVNARLLYGPENFQNANDTFFLRYEY